MQAINTSSKNISAVCGLAMYSKKKWLGGTSSMLNLVKPCKDPLEPLPSTVPDISYGSQPNAPQCSLPG